VGYTRLGAPLKTADGTMNRQYAEIEQSWHTTTLAVSSHEDTTKGKYII
jgi:hypothetical protein